MSDTGQPTDAVSLLAHAWVQAGLRAPTAASVDQAEVCVVPECRARAFVRLKTTLGTHAVCRGHFEEIKVRT
jgi:hypothetical protein